MKKTLERSWAHVAWANSTVGEHLAGLVGRRGVEEALRLFSHLVASERVWLDRIRDGSSVHPVWPSGASGWDATALLRMAAQNVEEVRELLRRSEEETLERPVAYRNTAGTRYETSLGDILLHVALHGSYHRGQIARSLREAGLEPVNTDYVTFVRENASAG
jgi:uncharacterized damage-inducible protein DinB